MSVGRNSVADPWLVGSLAVRDGSSVPLGDRADVPRVGRDRRSPWLSRGASVQLDEDALRRLTLTATTADRVAAGWGHGRRHER
jgi:hypothetical protein